MKEKLNESEDNSGVNYKIYCIECIKHNFLIPFIYMISISFSKSKNELYVGFYYYSQRNFIYRTIWICLK